MARFGMDLSLSEQELHSVDNIFQSADNALVLTNDYYSWEREYAASQRVGAGRTVNSVELLMRTKGLTTDDAKQAIKQHIIAYEKEYSDRKNIFYQTHPDISISLKRWIEVAGTIIAGNHYWCTKCPRHHVFETQEGRSDPEAMITLDEATSSSGSEASRASSRSSVTSEEDFNQSKELMPNGTRKDSAARIGPSHVNSYSWSQSDSSVILAPCEYLKTMPSKGIRKSLIDALNDWFHIPKASIKIIEEIIRLLHDASLILDDIEDNSPLRRGKPAVHTIFGHSQAINSANFMFVQAVTASRQLRSQKAVDILLDDLERLYVGQSFDLNWKYTLHCPTEEEYLSMIDNKTGGMFRMLTGLIRAEKDSYPGVSFDALLILFGRFFQVRDDYMNLASEQYSDQKGFCEDFDEGKFSYPIVHCLQHSPQARSQILGIFRQRPTALGGNHEPLSVECKMHLLDCLKASSSLEATLAYVNRLEDELESEIDRLEALTGEENPMLRLLLKRLSQKNESDHPQTKAATFGAFDLPGGSQRILGEPHAAGTISPLALRPSNGVEETSLDSAIEGIKSMQAQGGTLTKKLATHGSLLIRGVPIHDALDFSRFVHAFGFKPHELIGNVKGGGELAPGVAYANEAPPQVQIYSHNESAHVPNAPGYIIFYGHRVPSKGYGGESPISSSLELFQRAEKEMPDFVAELAAKGVLSRVTYKTNQQYPGGSTLLEAFGKDVLATDDKTVRRAKMEDQIRRYGRGQNTTWEWQTDADGEEETLILTHRLPGIRTQAGTNHPSMFTGLAAYWKNLERRLANNDSLAQKRGGQMQQLYGDGSAIPNEYLAKLAAITDELRVLHQWERGDVLIFDNTITQHGRQPWVGNQEDRVIMASLWDGDLPGAYGDGDWAQVVQPLEA
jgi:ophiobolin F synthase